MGKVYLVVGVIVVTGLLYFSLFRDYTNDFGKDVGDYQVQNSENPAAVQSEEIIEKPVITETKLEGGWEEVVVEKPYLRFEIPEDWYYGFEYFQEFEFEGKTYYHLNGIMNNGAGKNVSMIVNFQGGWCEGPEKVEPTLLAEKYGLPGRHYECGKSDVFVYGDMDKPGAVIPNFFVSTNNHEDSEIRRILDSLVHKPEWAGNIMFNVIHYTY